MDFACPKVKRCVLQCHSVAGVWHSHPLASTVVVSLVQVEDGALVEVFEVGRIQEGAPKGCKY